MTVRNYKRVKFSPEDFKVLRNITNQEVECPFQEEIDLWVEWRADNELTVWLVYSDGTEIPYATGFDGHFNLLTKGLLSIVLKSSKKTTVAVCATWRDLRVKDRISLIPVEIPLPEALPNLPLSSLVGETIRAELARYGITEEVEIGEEDNLEEDEDDEGFGPGFMEDEIPRTRKGGKEGGSPPEPVPADARSSGGGDAPDGSQHPKDGGAKLTPES